MVTRNLLGSGQNLTGRVPVDIRLIGLDEAFPLLGVDGLVGTGALRGKVPLRIADGKLMISNGTLRASGPGRLRFTGPVLAKQLAARPDTAGTVSKVLSDFHYRKLTVQFDKRAGDLGRVRLHMEGANPKAYDGRPVVFNIQIESDFKKFKSLCLPRRADLSRSLRTRHRLDGCGTVAAR
ncbi:MAG: YdbH domain-containing protein [Alphaproteobacteria bacterium]|nr:YdbH domain-containing protein [Alphaproteobacteria bacterium]